MPQQTVTFRLPKLKQKNDSLTTVKSLCVQGFRPGFAQDAKWQANQTAKRRIPFVGGMSEKQKETMKKIFGTFPIYENGPYNRDLFNAMKDLARYSKVANFEREKSNVKGCLLHGKAKGPPLSSKKRPFGEVYVMKRTYDRLEKATRAQIFQNAHLQAPLATITLRWHVRLDDEGYTAVDIYSYMSDFGPIRKVTMTSINTALVIFEKIESACEAVKIYHHGRPDNIMMCFWYHNCMKNKKYLCDGRRRLKNKQGDKGDKKAA